MSPALANIQEFNRRAIECSGHRMQIVSSETILVNPRYDDGSTEPHNVKEWRTVYRCAGSCKQEREQITKNR